MRELSMNVLDIAENSAAAGATLIEIDVSIRTAEKRLTIAVKDNGRGMSPQLLKTAADPFTTTRETRSVGMGLSLFKMAAERTGGKFFIESAPNFGTTVSAGFTLGHIDLMPLGDMASTVTALVQCNPDIDFIFTVSADGDSFSADTRKMRPVLGEEVDFSEPRAALWLNEYLAENTNQILKRSIVL